MKKFIILAILYFICNTETNAQDFMSTYNLSRNDQNSLRLYEEEYRPYDYREPRKRGRFMRTMMYTGLLVGGLVIGQQAAKQEYYMNNTTIYGIGGIMTILATGLVISSVNGINKELYFSVKNEGLTMTLALK